MKTRTAKNLSKIKKESIDIKFPSPSQSKEKNKMNFVSPSDHANELVSSK